MASETMGIKVYDPESGETFNYLNTPTDSRSLSHNRVRATYEDPFGRIWVGANNVINLWDSTTGYFTRYSNTGFKDAGFEIHRFKYIVKMIKMNLRYFLSV
jgi:hypothetical protein